LPGELGGLVADPAWKEVAYPGDPWSLGDTIHTGIGQGFTLVTPLQLLNAISAIANGGTLYQPQIVRELRDVKGNVVKPFEPKALRELKVSQQTIALVQEGMRQAVLPPNGTASTTQFGGVEAAGKTGTAEHGSPDEKGVFASYAWFAAYAPYDSPTISVLVLIDGGEKQLEGSTYAVPVAADLLQYYLTGVPQDGDNESGQ
jgi:penicillin-binding protein 2